MLLRGTVHARGRENSQTLHSQCDKVPTRFRCFLQVNEFRLVAHSMPSQRLGRTLSRTLDHSSMSISPTVVSMMTRPFVGSAMMVGLMWIRDVLRRTGEVCQSRRCRRIVVHWPVGQTVRTITDGNNLQCGSCHFQRAS